MTDKTKSETDHWKKEAQMTLDGHNLLGASREHARRLLKTIELNEALKLENEELQKERDKLRAEVERLSGVVKCPCCGEEMYHCPDNFAHIDVVNKLRADLAVAVDALKFYADSDSYDREGVCEHKDKNGDYGPDWWVDYGFTARETLAKIGAGDK